MALGIVPSNSRGVSRTESRNGLGAAELLDVMAPRRRSDNLVVLPTYNERDNLEPIVGGILATGHDVLIVDDNSPDGTGIVADTLASSEDGVEVLHRPRKLGLGTAYVTGFKIGLERGYSFILEMDADGSHQIEDLGTLIEAAAQAGGVSIGSRYVPAGGAIGWSLERRLLSRMANAYCRILLGRGLRDWTSGFRCYSAAVLRNVGIETIVSDGFSFQIELAYRCLQHGVPVIEVPIRFKERTHGTSKASGAEIQKALICVSRLRRQTVSSTRRGPALPGRRGRPGVR